MLHGQAGGRSKATHTGGSSVLGSDMEEWEGLALEPDESGSEVGPGCPLLPLWPRATHWVFRKLGFLHLYKGNDASLPLKIAEVL